jgi:putative transposase
MKELAEQRRRFGCRRLHVLLKRESLVDNHKRTERIYRQEKLALRIRRRKKLASQGRIEISKAGRAVGDGFSP